MEDGAETNPNEPTHHIKKSKNLWPFISAGLLLHLQILRQAEDKAIGNALPAGQHGCWNAEAQLAKCHASNLTLVKQTKPARFWFWSVELLEPCHDQLYQQSPGSYKHVVLRCRHCRRCFNVLQAFKILWRAEHSGEWAVLPVALRYSSP